jgi:ABC-type glycerol-3-phosphate transport system permease component
MQFFKKSATRNAITESSSDRTFIIFNNLFLLMIALIVLIPLLYVLSASFTSPNAVQTGRIGLIPTEFSLDGYQAVFSNSMIWTGFANSLFYTVVGTIVNLIMTVIAGYALANRNLIGRRFILFAFLVTLLFDSGLIPNYLLVRDLGLYNTRLALIVPKALSVWNLLIAMTYFRTSIPEELYEAAQIDGCSHFRYLIAVVIPLSRPIIAVLALFYAVGHWNTYFDALLYLRDQSLFPLQIILREILVENQVSSGMLTNVRELAAKQALRDLLKYALIVVASVPVLLLYPFVQRHFVKGIFIGSVK